MPLVVDGVQIPIDAEIDQSSFAKGVRAIESIKDAQRELDLEEKAIAANRTKEMADRAGMSVKAYLKMQQAAENYAKAAKAKQDEYYRSLMQTREAAERLQQVGMMAGVAGAAILTPMILSAKKFADSAREGDQVAQQWKYSISSLENDGNRAGRVIADQLNPALRATADIVHELVGILEKNPGIAGAALTVGGGLIGISALTSVVATVERTVATLKGLTATAGAITASGAAAQGVTSGAAGAAAGSVVVPVAIIGLSIAAIAAIGGAIKQASGDTGKMKGAGYLPGGLSESQRKAAEERAKNGDAQRQPQTQAKYYGGTRLPDSVEKENEAKTDRFLSKFNADLAEAQKKIADAQQKIIDTEREGAQKRLEIIMQYEARKQQVLADLARQNADALANYNRARADAIKATEDEIENIKRATRSAGTAPPRRKTRSARSPAASRSIE